MKMTMFLKLFTIGMTLIMLIGISAAATANDKTATVQWLTYDQAKARGMEQKQKYLLYFKSRNCGYCRLLEDETFKDAAVLNFINSNYIPVRVDVDKEKNIAARYRIRGVPDLRFLAKDGSAISRWVGFAKPDHLFKMLKFIYSDSYLKMNFNEFVAQRQ